MGTGTGTENLDRENKIGYAGYREQGRSQLKSATVSYLLRTGVFIFGKQCKTVFLSCFAQIHRGPQTPMAKGSSATV